MFDSLQEKLTKSLRNIQGKGRLSERNMEETLKEIRIALLESDVNYTVVKNFLERVRQESIGKDVLNSVEPGQLLVKIVHDEIVKLLGDEDNSLHFNEKGLTLIMVVGLQGTGKTTQAAKLANLLKKQGRKPILIAGDIIRPAAIEQLQSLGKQINVEVYSQGLDVSVLTQIKNGISHAKLKGYDTVIIDTAGRLQIDEALMNELKVLKKSVKPHEILLVVDALTGQDAVNIANGFNDALGIDGIIMTKMDGDSRGGAALSVKAVTGKPIKFMGTGEKYTALEPFYPDRIASRILGMGDVMTLIEQAENAFDEEETRKLEEKIRKNKFDLDDFLTQMRQINKMGGLAKLIDMIPGISAADRKNLDLDAGKKELGKMEAIILSMTAKERRDPSILNASRRKRIAAGSGTSVQSVNQLIKKYEEMKKMTKAISNPNSKKARAMMRNLGF